MINIEQYNTCFIARNNNGTKLKKTINHDEMIEWLINKKFTGSIIYKFKKNY